MFSLTLKYIEVPNEETGKKLKPVILHLQSVLFIPCVLHQLYRVIQIEIVYYHTERSVYPVRLSAERSLTILCRFTFVRGS